MQKRTENARFLKPLNETCSCDSRLRHDILLRECTAKACLYLWYVFGVTGLELAAEGARDRSFVMLELARLCMPSRPKTSRGPPLMLIVPLLVGWCSDAAGRVFSFEAIESASHNGAASRL